MKEITSQELIDRILCADADELNDAIDALEKRFREVWPDWELLVISAEGHTPEQHIKTLQHCITIMTKCIKNDLP